MVAIENAALRQQLPLFKEKRPRPRVRGSDRVFWVLLRRFWSGWSNAIIIVKPGTTRHHARRRIRRANVTAYPGAERVIQPLGEAFPFDETLRYLVLDRDAIFRGRATAAWRGRHGGGLHHRYEWRDDRAAA